MWYSHVLRKTLQMQSLQLFFFRWPRRPLIHPLLPRSIRQRVPHNTGLYTQNEKQSFPSDSSVRTELNHKPHSHTHAHLWTELLRSPNTMQTHAELFCCKQTAYIPTVTVNVHIIYDTLNLLFHCTIMYCSLPLVCIFPSNTLVEYSICHNILFFQTVL